MDFISTLNNDLEKWFLLLHPFYKSWNEGSLSLETLQTYAKEYYNHVSAFPRYISQIHTNCKDIEDRQVLLENLNEEEQGSNNHPELWLRFIEGLGLKRKKNFEPKLKSTENLVSGFFKLTKANYAEGLGALYAYERQTPLVAKSKIEGLQAHYNIQDSNALEFFKVHQEADEWHTEQLVKLINKLDDKGKKKVYEGAIKAAKLLWNFLDGINEIQLSKSIDAQA